jgi:iron complex outermembrane recepter protein
LSVDTKSFSVFANGSFNITDQLSLTAGARWTRDKKEFEGTIRTFALAPIFPTVDLERSFKAFTPKFGIDYKADPFGPFDSLLLYASVGRGFKSGGFNGIAFGNINVLNTPYDPERNWTYEWGVKADLFDRRMRFNASSYINEIKDLTMTSQLVVGGNVSFPVQNAGNARIKGFELETSVIAIEGLTLFANVNLQNGKYTSLRAGSAAAGAAALYGRATPPQVPDVSYTVGFNLDVPSPFQEGGAFIAGFDHYYTDDYFIAAANDFIIDSYRRSNGYVGYRFSDNLEMRLEATNLSNGVDISSGARIFAAVAVEPPRKYMFTLSYKR